MGQAQQLARAGKKLAAAPKPAPAVKVQEAVGSCMAEPPQLCMEISKDGPVGGGHEAPGAAGAAARDGNGAASPQASSEATVLLADLAGDQDADSADAYANMAEAAEKENMDAAIGTAPRPAALTPVKRPLQANLPGTCAFTPSIRISNLRTLPFTVLLTLKYSRSDLYFLEAPAYGSPLSTKCTTTLWDNSYVANF